MSRGVWGAMAGLGQGMSQFAGFMYEDIKQQRLEAFRSAEADKDRKWRSEEAALARKQDQDQFDKTFNAQDQLRQKQLDLLETNLEEANINLDELRGYKSAREAYIANPTDETRKTLEDTLFSMGKLRDNGFELIKLKTADELGGETETPYIFNKVSGKLIPAFGGGGGEPISADELAFVRENLDDDDVVNDFMSTYGVDPRKMFGREESGDGVLGKVARSYNAIGSLVDNWLARTGVTGTNRSGGGMTNRQLESDTGTAPAPRPLGGRSLFDWISDYNETNGYFRN